MNEENDNLSVILYPSARARLQNACESLFAFLTQKPIPTYSSQSLIWSLQTSRNFGTRCNLKSATEINKKAANLVNNLFSKDLAAFKFSLKLVKKQIY